MKHTLLATTAALTILAASAAQASPVTWSLDSPLGDLGPTFTWNSAGMSLTAMAVGPGDPHLWAENNGADDIGLGETLSLHGDNEITAERFVQFSVSGGVLTSLSLDSTIPHDTGEIFGSNTPGTLGTLLGTSDSHAPFALAPGYLFYDVTALPLAQQPAGSNDTILVGSVSGTPTAAVPEPASAALVLTGMAGLWFANRRRTRRHGLG